MELVLPNPNEKQRLFLQDRHKYIAFGGARGGGKSWAVRVKAILLCYKYPGIKVMIVRRSYPELRENHIIPLCTMLHIYDVNPKKRLARYNKSDKNIMFPNGSRILFQYCETDKDAERFQGTEVDVLFVDEATHQTEERIRKINACVRGINGFPKRTYYTCNPGGVGHAWVKRLFVDRNFKDRETPEDYMFIQSLVKDNKILMDTDPDYIKQLEALPPKLREAWLNGKWDIFEGQVFEEWRDDPAHYDDRLWTHVVNPFPIPDSWPIYRAMDWGYARPFSIGWYAIAPGEVIYRIRELYGCTGEPNVGVKWTADKVASMVYEIEHDDPNLRGKFIYGVADTAIFASDNGVPVSEDFEKWGIYFDKGDKHRIAGKMQCHYRLAFDEDGQSMFHVFKTCQHFIRCIPLLIYDEKNVEDVDTSMEDHNYDEWRYMCMARPIEPRIPVQPEPWTPPPEDPLDMM